MASNEMIDMPQIRRVSAAAFALEAMDFSTAALGQAQAENASEITIRTLVVKCTAGGQTAALTLRPVVVQLASVFESSQVITRSSVSLLIMNYMNVRRKTAAYLFVLFLQNICLLNAKIHPYLCFCRLWQESRDTPPIVPTLQLYRELHKQGYHPTFVTGRCIVHYTFILLLLPCARAQPMLVSIWLIVKSHPATPSQ